MADDIVARLRRPLPYNLAGMTTTQLGDERREAADEIERLREWKELAYQMRNKYWWAMRWRTLKKFDAMHKADWALPHNVALRADLQKHWGK